jgi:hypothetical protein
MHTYRLLVRGGDSSESSFALPLLVLLSRERLDLVMLAEDRELRVVTVSGSVVEDEGCSADSRSLPFSFCFAALTLALERKALVSAEDAEEDGWYCSCVASRREDVLALLVASG